MELSKIILNPIRHRIIQYYTMHEDATVGQLSRVLNDIPIASLYRHVNILAENQIILKKDERKIRGTIEVLYQINPNWNHSTDNDDRNADIQAVLMDISNNYNVYFADEAADPGKDMIFSSSAVLMLTDEDFKEYLMKLNDITKEYLEKEEKTGSKQRRLIQFSLPT